MRYDEMLPYVLPSLGGCPEDLAERYLRLAAIEFFDSTGVWINTLPDVLTVSETQVYAMPLPNDSALARLLEVSVDGEAVDALVGVNEAKRLMRALSSDSFAWVVDQRDIGLWPMPVNDQVVVVETILKPSITSIEVPDEYAEHYVMDIAKGALSKLLKLPRVPWQSLQDAAFCEGEFRSAITAAAGMAGTGHLQGRLRVRPA